MTKEMQRWLKAYENERVRAMGDEHIGWTSSRYDLESKDWSTIKEIFIPELEMTFAQACSALKRSWYAYKMSRKEGSRYNSDLGWRINRLQYYLGISMTEFENAPYPIEYIKQQLQAEEQGGEQVSTEEVQLKYEEVQSDGGGWGGESGRSEPEDPEYTQLRREEKEDLISQIEADEW